jgi:hypothetical protein
MVFPAIDGGAIVISRINMICIMGKIGIVGKPEATEKFPAEVICF